MKKKLLLPMLIFISIPGFTQLKTTEHFSRSWIAYFNQSRLSDKWGLWMDVHLRTQDEWVNGFSQSIIRAGVTYYLSDATKLTAGYAYVHEFPGENHKNISSFEHRPWQQLQWHTQYGNQRMMQWIRIEERYRHKIKNDNELAKGYNYNWRFRYNIWYEIPLTKKGVSKSKWSCIINDEVHINAGSQIINNYFDQNRFFAGFKYQLNKHSNVQFGYMNWFQQLTAGNKYRNSNIIRLFFFQNFDWRIKDNKK